MAPRSFLLIPVLVVYFISGIAAADRAPANALPPHQNDADNEVNRNVNREGSVQGAGAMDDSDIINLADHPACKSDVMRLCDGVSNGKKDGDATKQAKNSLDVLECFLNHDDKAVSADCHQVMHNFKLNITKDKRIASIAAAQCADDLKEKESLKDCNDNWSRDPGHFISCIVEEKQKIKNEGCLVFVNKVALVVFSDYRLVEKFASACESDIARLKCAFVDNKKEHGHSQGAVIACLVRTLEHEHQTKMAAEHANDEEAKKYIANNVLISNECSHQVLRLMELQADDYHLDRALFFACRDERELLCHDVRAGEGKVYQCLQLHKGDEKMGQECKEQLGHREQAAQANYKVDYGLGHICQAEILHHKCVPPQDLTHEYGVSYIILCLEGAIHQAGENVVRPDCKQAMYQHRQSMMSDYNVSPNIVLFCKQDVTQFCSNVPPKAIIHCLMGAAKEQVNVGTKDAPQYSSKLSAPCSREIGQILLGADVASDVRVDTLLTESCSNIMEKNCHAVKSTAHMMGCLMEHMHVPEMTEQCEKHLLESHFFITRDIRLDSELYGACKKEAVEICHLKEDWSPERKDQAPETGPLTMGCLYRHAFLPEDRDKTGLSATCLEQVKKTMHQRAIAMDIPPEVDVRCIHDLAYFCAEKQYKKGQEFNCLQEHYAKLQQECKAAVQHFTQAAQKDIKLSVTYQNCAPMKFCLNQLNQQSTFDDAMDCLIPHKEDDAMVKQKLCLAEINHYQMVNIQEFQLNIRFKESCKEDSHNFCPSSSNDIGETVLCLSSILREDTVTGKSHRLSKACRSQLRHELLTRAEEAQLDPVITNACKPDIASLCPVGVSPNNLLECLREKVSQLSDSCHKVLFKVEAAQAVDEFADFTLVQACRRAIEKSCRDVAGDELLPCLISAKHDNKLDPKCLKVVTTRQLEESKDIRLNPALYKACNQDLAKFCERDLAALLKQDKEAVDAEGNLIMCLRKHKKNLSNKCVAHIMEMRKEAAFNYRLDPRLAGACEKDAKHCKETEEGKGEVVECLKELFRKHALKDNKCAIEVARMVSDGKADIHIDPILFSACQLDLKKYCLEVQPGEGRQFQCLANALADGQQMVKECANKLTERIQLQKFAQEISPPEDLQELAESVYESPSRNYFLAVLGGAVLGVLVVGICCGRASKRIRKELKNR
ncbi:Golgi apparatus protein 1 [Hypsibius exemplaris]|uniref:Golgi apparatus protein 1 n=1 Tax=Hypsibius exemplaris TaxID=2072580 RepID=A0A1W0WSN2_HYPEX|nr:Golgi apparatus protein 1 [Hypsibius exemplaris]